MPVSTTSISLHINGVPHDVPGGMKLFGLLRHIGRDPGMPGVAVAVGSRVIRRAEWPETALADGDRVEIITAAQGG